LDVATSYSELGLTAASTDAEIKVAWRRLAARWHPDRNDSPAALRKIQRINRALEQIRNSRRAALEIGGETDDNSASENQAETKARKGHSAKPERVLHHTVRITLEDAVAGCVKVLQGELVDDCAECAATGLQAHASGCPACGGAGQLRQPLWFGWASTLVECTVCRGRGVVRQPCCACEATGKAQTRQYRCRVTIPAGTRDGDLLQFPSRAQSHAGPYREALSVRIQLQSHEFFELEEDGTVRCEIPVDGFAWIANRWVQVPTPAGLQQMKLRRGHLGYRIKGQGFPSERSGPRADCIITIVPLFPEEFSSKQEAQIDRLIASNSSAARTAAGIRASEWGECLEKWQSRLSPESAQDAQG
jgi:molecular chaperone DnaJ